ncbi:GAF domain-containing sensor histidine kinase [Nocardiopsis halophila]|uniref:GAF domain-containing sensor histidine kinase n=1 Tax=Nocardiopsis halophila TaxID=141692 RepID=UPI0003460D2C|nr:GAF domain-containing sensor histidine kinase [Nocardiopsis halophila]
MGEEVPGPERARFLLPRLHLDDLLSELQSRIDSALLTRDRVHSLLDAVVTIGSGLDVEAVLRRLVQASMDLVDARYGALGVIGPDGELTRFLPLGLGEGEIARIDHWPQGQGILGLLIKDPRPLRLRRIEDHPESRGFPEGHPPMRGFLGVPIRVRDSVFGNLYLTEKADGGEFDEDDEAIVIALSTAAGVAIENARLYEETRRRELLLDASDEVTTRLLTGAETGDVLALIARRARRMSGSVLAALAIPSPGGEGLVVDTADGEWADRVQGRSVELGDTATGRAYHGGGPVALPGAEEGGCPLPFLADLEAGPVLLAPLGGRVAARGLLVLAREHGDDPYTATTGHLLSAFSGHAAVALELAEARVDAERLSVLEDRDRIAKDLHDVIIQRLFAVAMSLMSTVRRTSDRGHAQRVQRAVDDLDDTIRQIRSTIFALQHAGGEDRRWLRTQILDIANASGESLGFTPGLRLEGPIDSRVPDGVAEHVMAVLQEALSNIARHAGASRADIRVRVTDDLVEVDVSDDGCGIPEDGRRGGLHNLQERARALGGSFEIRPAVGGGTRLLWNAPLGEED